MSKVEEAAEPEIPVTVVNKRQKKTELVRTYIGRGSVYGNPFRMELEEERDQVCDAYDAYFIERLSNDPSFVEAMARLARIAKRQGYLKLECFCAPRRCHGDTLAKYVRQLLADKPNPDTKTV